jgi:hypothetical protein
MNRWKAKDIFVSIVYLDVQYNILEKDDKKTHYCRKFQKAYFLHVYSMYLIFFLYIQIYS